MLDERCFSWDIISPRQSWPIGRCSLWAKQDTITKLLGKYMYKFPKIWKLGHTYHTVTTRATGVFSVTRAEGLMELQNKKQLKLQNIFQKQWPVSPFLTDPSIQHFFPILKLKWCNVFLYIYNIYYIYIYTQFHFQNGKQKMLFRNCFHRFLIITCIYIYMFPKRVTTF